MREERHLVFGEKAPERGRGAHKLFFPLDNAEAVDNPLSLPVGSEGSITKCVFRAELLLQFPSSLVFLCSGEITGDSL